MEVGDPAAGQMIEIAEGISAEEESHQEITGEGAEEAVKAVVILQENEKVERLSLTWAGEPV